MPCRRPSGPDDGARIRPRATTALALAGALTLAGCADDDPVEPDTPVEAPDGLDETDDPADDDPDGPDPTDPGDGDVDVDGADEDAVEPLGAEASTEDREEPGEGFGLTVTDVRVGTHDGFDRVTVELDGDDQVGWFTRWGDEAIADGSGQEVDVAGDAVLTLAVDGVLLPGDRDDDVEAWDGRTVPAADGSVVLTEVVEGTLFEGQHQLFLGAEQQVAYRIERFEDPQRIVIDLVHD